MRYGVVYIVTLLMKKPGAYQLRDALRDKDSERIGSASQFVDVPDIKKNRLALSSFIVKGLSAAEYARNNAPVESPFNSASAPNTQTNAATPQSEAVDVGDAKAGPSVR